FEITNHGTHGIRGKKTEESTILLPSFFRVFRVFRGFSSLHSYQSGVSSSTNVPEPFSHSEHSSFAKPAFSRPIPTFLSPISHPAKRPRPGWCPTIATALPGNESR